MKINRYTETIIRQRATPNLVNEAAAAYAGTVFRAGAEGLGIAAGYFKKLEDAETRTWLNKAIIETQKEAFIRSDKTRTDPNAQYKGFADNFKTDISKYYQDYAKNAPNEEARQAYIEATNELDFQVYKDNKSWENRKSVEVGAENIKTATQDLENMAYQNKVMNRPNDDLYKQADATTIAASDIYSTEQLALLNKEIYQRIEKSELDALYDTNPAELVRETTVGKYSVGDIDADKAIEEIMRLEGGYVENDAGAGPTLYGINSSANPKEYAAIKALYDAGKTVDAKNKAKETYKKKYWDGIGADNLPSELRLAAFDSAVNQGQGAAKEMIAQSGGDASKFTALRKARYLKTAQSNPSKAQFLNAWLDRTDKTSRASKGSELPASILMDYKKKGEEAYKKVQLKETAESMRFMPIEAMFDVAINSGEEFLIKQAQQYQEAITKDPAGYVMQHPDIQLITSKLQYAQTEAEQSRLIADRNSMLLEIQNEMGVQDYRQSVVPAEAAKEAAYAMMDIQTSPEQVLSILDNYSAQFKGFESDAIGQLKQNGMKDIPLAAILTASPSSDRISFVKSVRAFEENKGLIDQEDFKSIKSNVHEQIKKITPTITHLPNYQSDATAYSDGITAMAVHYAVNGMSAKDAVKKATEEIFGKSYKILDKTLLIPSDVSEKAVRRFLNKQHRFIKTSDVAVPDSVPMSARKDYIDEISRKAEPRIVDSYIMFFDYAGVPLLNKSKIKYDKNGNITNAYDAAIRVNVHNAAAMGEVMPTYKDYGEERDWDQNWEKQN